VTFASPRHCASLPLALLGAPHRALSPSLACFLAPPLRIKSSPPGRPCFKVPPNHSHSPLTHGLSFRTHLWLYHLFAPRPVDRGMQDSSGSRSAARLLTRTARLAPRLALTATTGRRRAFAVASSTHHLRSLVCSPCLFKSISLLSTLPPPASSDASHRLPKGSRCTTRARKRRLPSLSAAVSFSAQPRLCPRVVRWHATDR